MTYRLDLADIAEYSFAHNGTLKVKGFVAKTGDLLYYDADGNEHIEYVSPEVLFDSEHLSTIGLAPLTLLHPKEPINPRNYSDYIVGSAGDRVIAHLDKGLIEVTFVVGDHRAIDAITSGEAKQLSMGYSVRLVPTEDPKRFLQKDRRADHIAAVPLGRAGSQVAFKFDNQDSFLSYPKSLLTEEKIETVENIDQEKNNVVLNTSSKSQKSLIIESNNQQDQQFQKWRIISVMG